jgi:hypothetical protein
VQGFLGKHSNAVAYNDLMCIVCVLKGELKELAQFKKYEYMCK